MVDDYVLRGRMVSWVLNGSLMGAFTWMKHSFRPFFFLWMEPPVVLSFACRKCARLLGLTFGLDASSREQSFPSLLNRCCNIDKSQIPHLSACKVGLWGRCSVPKLDCLSCHLTQTSCWPLQLNKTLSFSVLLYIDGCWPSQIPRGQHLRTRQSQDLLIHCGSRAAGWIEFFSFRSGWVKSNWFW